MADSLPLAGIRVTDFSWAWSGPLATGILADMGAEVIKVETRKRPDVSRITGPYPDETRDIDRSGLFISRNRNKLSCSIDLSTAAGQDLARRLVSISDITVENFSPRVMERYGLTYDSLCQLKPDLIMLSLTGFGQGNYTLTVGFIHATLTP